MLSFRHHLVSTPTNPTLSAARQQVPPGELAGVPLLMHHKLGDADGHRARFIGGQAVSSQHHTVGSGGAGKEGAKDRDINRPVDRKTDSLQSGTICKHSYFLTVLWAVPRWAHRTMQHKTLFGNWDFFFPGQSVKHGHVIITTVKQVFWILLVCLMSSFYCLFWGGWVIS